jgi:hypothetical protein
VGEGEGLDERLDEPDRQRHLPASGEQEGYGNRHHEVDERRRAPSRNR